MSDTEKVGTVSKNQEKSSSPNGWETGLHVRSIVHDSGVNPSGYYQPEPFVRYSLGTHDARLFVGARGGRDTAKGLWPSQEFQPFYTTMESGFEIGNVVCIGGAIGGDVKSYANGRNTTSLALISGLSVRL